MTPAQSKIRDWRANPKQFAHECLKFTPDKWQEEVLDVFPSQDPKKLRIALQACAGPGKSAILAVCGWNFLACYAGEGRHPKGAAISCTWDNLRDNLWPEFATWQSRSEFLTRAFTWTKERIFANQFPRTWFFSARSWSKTASAEEQGRTLSGLHADFVLFLIDESGDIPVTVLRAANQARSSAKWFKVMQAGNPTSHEGMLYAASSELAHQWYGIRITGDPDDPKRSPRIDLAYAREEIETWGRDNPWVMAYILGQFPPSSINTLLGPDEVRDAMKRHLREDVFEFSQRRLGIDVAREGDDRTVIFPRQGLAAFNPVEMRNAKGHEIAARVAKAKAAWGSEMEFFDDTGGWAGAALEHLEQAGYTPTPVNFAGKAIDSRYFNKRAEMWFEMADWVKKGGALPNDPQLLRELTAPTYTFRKGKFLLEEKEQIKKRLRFSPDKADALCLTFALPEMPAQFRDGLRIRKDRNKADSDWDPYRADQD